jgi:hypothetical protein
MTVILKYHLLCPLVAVLVFDLGLGVYLGLDQHDHHRIQSIREGDCLS